MKKLKFNKDGSRDYVMTKKEFDEEYVVGCLMTYKPYGRPNSKTVVRVYGEVSDLRNVVLRRRKRR